MMKYLRFYRIESLRYESTYNGEKHTIKEYEHLKEGK